MHPTTTTKTYLPKMSHLHFIFSFFLLSLLLSPSITSAAESLLDTDGNPLSSSGSYYVLPVSWGAGGGLNIAAIQDHHTRCPYYSVVQSQDDRCGSNLGLPVTFTPSDLEEGQNITLATDFSIDFNIRPPHAPRFCDQPTTTWEMVSVDGPNNIGAQLGSFHHGGLTRGGGDDKQGSLFKMVKNKAYGYRLRYCPTNSSKNSPLKNVVCGDLAPVYDRRLGVRVLSLVDDSYRPFEIMFKKA